MRPNPPFSVVRGWSYACSRTKIIASAPVGSVFDFCICSYSAWPHRRVWFHSIRFESVGAVRLLRLLTLLRIGEFRDCQLPDAVAYSLTIVAACSRSFGERGVDSSVFGQVCGCADWRSSTRQTLISFRSSALYNVDGEDVDLLSTLREIDDSIQAVTVQLNASIIEHSVSIAASSSGRRAAIVMILRSET
jgi:hypothetical protein